MEAESPEVVIIRIFTITWRCDNYDLLIWHVRNCGDGVCDLHESESRLKVSYLASTYQSFDRTARSYRRIVAELADLVPDVSSADIVLLQGEPMHFASIYRQHTCLKDKYVVGICAWEADRLPEEYRVGCSLVQEIWTCSTFCADAFSQIHSRVHYVPHVIERDLACTDDDQHWGDSQFGMDAELRFLVFGSIDDPRKNIDFLANTFGRLFQGSTKRLVIKAGRLDRTRLKDSGNVRVIHEWITEARVNALYRAADVVLSAHHAEGWGLALSDAFLFGKLVAATGYSGNLEFMSPNNSYLIPYDLEEVRVEDSFKLFRPPMKWAYVREEVLADALERVVTGWKEGHANVKIARAFETTLQFSRAKVSGVVAARLSAIGSRQVGHKESVVSLVRWLKMPKRLKHP